MSASKGKIITVIGARPQFIKAAALSRVINAHNELTEILLHTGQHYDPMLSQVFFDELAIPKPKYHFSTGSGSHGAQTGAMLTEIERVIHAEKPDLLLVYGDTNSTLAGALAAKKCGVRVVHVEAGLRSYNEFQPEEINRKVADAVADLLFATSPVAVQNLLREGVSADKIFNVGDIMLDSVRYIATRIQQQEILSRYQLQAGRYLLATLHRAENTNDLSTLEAILDALLELSHEWRIVLPIHPRTRHFLQQHNRFTFYNDKLHFIDPVGFADMAGLTQGARMVVTDSGGLQKESFYHGKTCAVLRHETEWTELVELQCNRLVPPTSKEAVLSGIRQALQTLSAEVANPYGDGKASLKIHQQLVEALQHVAA